jgi:hypothetical protein
MPGHSYVVDETVRCDRGFAEFRSSVRQMVDHPLAGSDVATVADRKVAPGTLEFSIGVIDVDWQALVVRELIPERPVR